MKKEFYKKIMVNGVLLFVTEEGRIYRKNKKGELAEVPQRDLRSNSLDNPYKVLDVGNKTYLAHRIILGAFSGGILPNL